MKLTTFRVQNYKNFDDTGWILFTNPTCIVGKNETGKTAILRGLSKINPSDGVGYDGLKEFPRNKYTSDFSNFDWPVSSAKFTLERDEIKELTGICSILKKVKEVIFIRYYSNDLTIEFDIDLPKKINYALFKNNLEAWHDITSKATTKGERVPQLEGIKNTLLPYLSEKIEENYYDRDEVLDEENVSEITNHILSNFNEEWHFTKFKKIVSDIDSLKAHFSLQRQIEDAQKYLREKLPIFVYFDEYGTIDSAIHIPRFIQELSATPDDPLVRSKKCLFDHVGLDVEIIQTLDPNDPNKALEELRRIADERAILMTSASRKMTNTFSKWWEQRKHEFRYQLDGPHFRIWVWDNIDTSEIELDQRSRGMQYFFSFYLVFLVESESVHENTILLLDEPGLHVHASAQGKIMEFLETLSKKNPLIYSTHSPFLINGDKLENVCITYEDPNVKVSKVTQDVWPPDKEALFPLQVGLAYNIAQTLFYSKRQLVVEGLTDYWILKGMAANLEGRGMKHLRTDAIITPAGGTKRMMPLASMLIGNEIKLVTLLDGDNPGIRKGKELTEN